MKVACSSGTADIEVGTKFKDGDTEWEVVAFTDGNNYSPSGLGGTPTIRCKPLTAPHAYWKQWMREDGTCDWCGDSIAARVLDASDGKNRGARGEILTK